MQYLLMCCFDEDRWEKIPEPERDEIMRQYGEFQQRLASSGHYRAGAKLGSSATATTVREKAGKVVITDGPFAETKEQLGGFYMIDAKDLNDAIQIASRIPSAKIGTIEVRPIVG
jgi:hypothetical protein